MDIRLYDDVETFWQVAGGRYEADPVRHTVALTVLANLRAGNALGTRSPVLLTVHDHDQQTGAALATPPFPLTASALPAAMAGRAADALAQAGVALDGVAGPVAAAEAFVRRWCPPGGVRVAMRERLYRLATLRPPAGVPGAARIAGQADVELLAAWRGAFVAEAKVAAPQVRAPGEYLEQVRRSMAGGACYLLWESGGAARSMAASRQPIAGMCRIGPVYTPPQYRGHGYGSAVTAAMSRWALRAGARHVVLFTDRANPVSNAIYQRIGFRPVEDFVEYAFGGE